MYLHIMCPLHTEIHSVLYINSYKEYRVAKLDVMSDRFHKNIMSI